MPLARLENLAEISCVIRDLGKVTQEVRGKSRKLAYDLSFPACFFFHQKARTLRISRTGGVA